MSQLPNVHVAWLALKRERYWVLMCNDSPFVFDLDIHFCITKYFLFLLLMQLIAYNFAMLDKEIGIKNNSNAITAIYAGDLD